ncbi:dynein assembly factor 3, axonemal [Electrophorus electricus]|uniref:dynein assembly factor 3, axonemal n=1 Tax=Electrophorus electricus TaxID=8005 RepID=UPI0015D04447|nr:dynein assembly factor 3, axonemal [Electrophorus electricus]XP_026875499.2 dynein assembly factor 3, axonemal [Electrophorus electricus]
MSAGRIMEGAGCVTWWGFGPARDVLGAGTVRAEGELNVLLVGSGDPRHILKTIAGLRDTDTLHVWVIENSMEVVARQLLLLWLSLTAPDSMSMHEKTEVFLEVFGNTEIRCQTEETVKHVAALLLLSVTNTIDTHTQSHPCLDTSLLKFKERDELIQIFAQWQQPPSATANMAKARDARVRRHLGTRYDSRLGSYDWDLTMKLHQKGCGVIHKQQYAKWRERGLAFEMREGLYQIANQSLLSTRVFNHRGDRVGLRGYWGDIVSSPYLAFGIETENKELLKTQNNQHVKSAQEISVANVQMLFESLAIRGGHPHKHQLGGKGVDLATGVETEPFQKNQDTMDNQMTKEETQTIKQACGIHAEVKEQPETPYKAKDLELMNLNGVRVSFLSLDSLSKLPTKGQFSQRFNSLYCSASMVHHLDSSLKQVAAPGALLMIELTKYLLDLSKEQEAAFTARVGEIAKDLGFISARDSSDNSYAVFTLQDD